MIPLTRKEIAQLERMGADRPPLFTGKWKGEHFYLGHHWTGPTNKLGHKPPREPARDRSAQKYGRGADIMWSGCFSAMGGR